MAAEPMGARRGSAAAAAAARLPQPPHRRARPYASGTGPRSQRAGLLLALAARRLIGASAVSSVPLEANQGCMVRGVRASVSAAEVKHTSNNSVFWLGVANTTEQLRAAGCFIRSMGDVGVDIICLYPICATSYSLLLTGPMAMEGQFVTWSLEGAIRSKTEHWTLAESGNSEAQADVYALERCPPESLCTFDSSQGPHWLSMSSGDESFVSWSVASTLNITDFPFSTCTVNLTRQVLALAFDVDTNQISVAGMDITAVDTRRNSTNWGVVYTLTSFSDLPQMNVAQGNKAAIVQNVVQPGLRSAVEMGDKYVRAEGQRFEYLIQQYQDSTSELMERFYAVMPRSTRLENGPTPTVAITKSSEETGQAKPTYRSGYSGAASVAVSVPSGLNTTSLDPVLQICATAEVRCKNEKYAKMLVSDRGQRALQATWATFTNSPTEDVMIDKISLGQDAEAAYTASRRLDDTGGAPSPAPDQELPVFVHFAVRAAGREQAQNLRHDILKASHRPSLGYFTDSISQHEIDRRSMIAILNRASILLDHTYARVLVPALWKPIPVDSPVEEEEAPQGNLPGNWILMLAVALLVLLGILAILVLTRRRSSNRKTKNNRKGDVDVPGDSAGLYKELAGTDSSPGSFAHEEAAHFSSGKPDLAYHEASGQGWRGSQPDAMYPEVTFWRYQPANDAGIGIRKEASIEGPMTDDALQPGDVFQVSEEVRGEGGVTYLRLADGRGWLFDHKPGIGTMCVRAEPEMQHPWEENMPPEHAWSQQPTPLQTPMQRQQPSWQAELSAGSEPRSMYPSSLTSQAALKLAEEMPPPTPLVDALQYATPGTSGRPSSPLSTSVLSSMPFASPIGTGPVATRTRLGGGLRAEDVLTRPDLFAGRSLGAFSPAGLPPRLSGGVAQPPVGLPTASLGLDLNNNGRPDLIVQGVDLNRNGIPDLLEHALQTEPAARMLPTR